MGARPWGSFYIYKAILIVKFPASAGFFLEVRSPRTAVRSEGQKTEDRGPQSKTGSKAVLQDRYFNHSPIICSPQLNEEILI